MNNTFKINHSVHYSEIDFNYNLRFDYILSAFQKITLLHSTELKVDAETLNKTSNAFWVLSKTKFKINRIPKLKDEITVETWPLPVTPIRYNREYKITSKSGVDIVGTSEWVTLDTKTRTLRKSSSITYPFELEHRTDVSGAGEYSRKREKVDENDFSYIHVVRFTDIDPNNHTNNVAYVKMVLNTFTIEEFNNANVTEFEIQYLTQSYYGNEIYLYKRKTDYGYYVEGKVNGKTAFISILK